MKKKKKRQQKSQQMVCPNCGLPMELVETRGPFVQSFWGCTGYPICKGVVFHGDPTPKPIKQMDDEFKAMFPAR